MAQPTNGRQQLAGCQPSRFRRPRARGVRRIEDIDIQGEVDVLRPIQGFGYRLLQDGREADAVNLRHEMGPHSLRAHPGQQLIIGD
jgi:hypothetical protein